MVVSGLMGIVGLPGISQAGDYTDAVKNMMEFDVWDEPGNFHPENKKCIDL